MRRWSLTLALSAAWLAVGCGDWPASYEQIDDQRPRCLDFVYQNVRDTTLCEAAPGDSLRVYAYLAGQEVTDIQWAVSFNSLETLYGEEFDFDTIAMDAAFRPVGREGFGGNTQCFSVSFKIPDSIMYVSEGLGDEYLAVALETMGMSKPELLTLVDSLSDMDPEVMAELLMTEDWADGLVGQVGALMSALVVPIRLHVRVNGIYRIRSNFNVRYNRKFAKALPMVPVNRNPVINYIAIYKLKGESRPILEIAEMTGEDTAYCLYISDTSAIEELVSPRLARGGTVTNVLLNDTLLIDTGYVYFAAVDTGIFNGSDQRDVGLVVDTDGDAGLSQEREAFFTDWFYEHEASEIRMLDQDDLVKLGGPNCIVGFLPPAREEVTSAVLWVQVYDELPGERLRPFASTLRETRVFFRYTDAYLND